MLPAVAEGGAEIDVETSASGEIAVVPVALSGSGLLPWLVAVSIDATTATEPLAGAVKLTPTLMVLPAPRLAGIPPKVTAPDAGSYVAVAPAGRPLKTTLVRPGGKPRVYVTLVAVDGPALEKLTVPLAVLPAVAEPGTDTATETSASGETAVVPRSLSGSVLGPWLVDVPIVAVAETAPDAGAENVTPMGSVVPAPSVVGIPAKVTPPVAAS